MRYKKVKAVSWQGNSDKNLILRQQFAKTFLKIDLSHKKIINVDESWLNLTTFHYMSWAPRGRSNSMPIKQMRPRISIIAALDSTGSVLISLLQCNNNSETMEMFFTYMIRHLDNKQPGWRRDTVILLDNASYHSSTTMMEFFEEFQVPICYTGPHSYAASPIELLFAHLKQGELNPEGLPTGKM